MSKKSKSPLFINLPHAVYDSPAFAALAPIDVLVLLLLSRKYYPSINGNISLGIREVASRCRCGKSTASRALENLQLAGLISATHKGHFVPEIGRPNVATRWRINYLPDTIKKPKLAIVNRAAQ